MPYIKSERVKEIRSQIKKRFPKFKFSIVRENYSGVRISVMEGPLAFEEVNHSGHYQINHYSFHGLNEAETKFFKSIYEIANSGNGILVVDGDYGAVPDFYVWLNVGRWDKQYIQNKK